MTNQTTSIDSDALRVGRLVHHIAEAVIVGAQQRGLGIIAMPTGYALMLNADHSHYYWVNHLGQESEIHWNKWAIYRGAKAHAAKAAQ
jgi:hypothetical protein